jgi:hypothetical protein
LDTTDGVITAERASRILHNAIAVLDSLGRRVAKSLAVGLDLGLGTIVILECIVESEETIRVHYIEKMIFFLEIKFLLSCHLSLRSTAK